jgi:hypothetical protein
MTRGLLTGLEFIIKISKYFDFLFVYSLILHTPFQLKLTA